MALYFSKYPGYTVAFKRGLGICPTCASPRKIQSEMLQFKDHYFETNSEEYTECLDKLIERGTGDFKKVESRDPQIYANTPGQVADGARSTEYRGPGRPRIKGRLEE